VVHEVGSGDKLGDELLQAEGFLSWNGFYCQSRAEGEPPTRLARSCSCHACSKRKGELPNSYTGQSLTRSHDRAAYACFAIRKLAWVLPFGE
jgi:hypothetical protein